jgi:ELWxxDGT repeat protein
VGETLYFRASDGVSGDELWKSDGTDAGTVRVKDIRSGSLSSNIDSLTNVGGTLYFQANDGVNGDALWKSDGTDAGTVLVKDFTGDSVGGGPASITEANGRLFVVTTTERFGTEIWVANLAAPEVPGDYDRNAAVDGADVLNWQRELGGPAAPPGSGADGSENGVVDGADLQVWKDHFGEPDGASAAASIAAVASAGDQAAMIGALPANVFLSPPAAAESVAARSVVRRDPETWGGESSGPATRDTALVLPATRAPYQRTRFRSAVRDGRGWEFGDAAVASSPVSTAALDDAFGEFAGGDWR